MSSFSVIIPSYNEGAWLERTVMGVLENTNYPEFEIIIVADNCTDNSTDFCKQKSIPNVVLLETSHNLGAIEARNYGASIAEGENLVFIDAHEVPETDNWISVLFDLLEKPNTGAATIPISSFEDPQRIGYVYRLKDLALEPAWESRESKHLPLVPVIPGGCFAIKKSVFIETGGFNPLLKKWGREDLEYSLRLWRMGYDLRSSKAAKIAHAFSHKRAFEISWDQVDHNILLIADLLFSSEACKKVCTHLKKIRPQNYDKIYQQLLNNEAYQAYKAKLLLKRSFEDYKIEFKDYLPKNYSLIPQV